MSNFQQLLLTLAPAKLIAVSKTKSIDDILELYHQGQRAFGENKVQEMVEKYHALPKDIEWHMIGHLQSNKVKQIAPFIHCIHSVDSSKLLFDIQKQAKLIQRTIPILLQVHIAEEETKYGMSNKEVMEVMEYYMQSADLKENVCIIGLMGMASNTTNTEQVQQEFRSLQSLFHFCKQCYLLDDTQFKELSMGMSSDYLLALQEGSTMIRIGSLLFGKR
jgi:pyridoxal phosphate enzyme (YggS family)